MMNGQFWDFIDTQCVTVIPFSAQAGAATSTPQTVVYKMPYRRAPRLACRVRRASKGILHTTQTGQETVHCAHLLI